MPLCIVSLCSGCDGCCAFCLIGDACSMRCSWSGSILISSCMCCVSYVHPVAFHNVDCVSFEVCSCLWRMQEATIMMRYTRGLAARLPYR